MCRDSNPGPTGDSISLAGQFISPSFPTKKLLAKPCGDSHSIKCFFKKKRLDTYSAGTEPNGASMIRGSVPLAGYRQGTSQGTAAAYSSPARELPWGPLASDKLLLDSPL